MASRQEDMDTIATMRNHTLRLDQATAVEDSLSLGEDLAAEADEPPDEMQSTPRPTTVQPAIVGCTGFSKTRPSPCSQKQSLLTQALHSESESVSDEEHHDFHREFSNTSTWSTPSIASTAELTSDGGFTSPGTRASSPSPPVPFMQSLPPLVMDAKTETSLKIRHETHIESVVPSTQKKDSNENCIEAGLGRKRCITFACGKKENPATPPQEQKPIEPATRVRAVKFACNVNTTTKKSRFGSPPPPQRTPKAIPRAHRDSDSTVKNDSPKAVRKVAPTYGHGRKFSVSSDICRREATRFHEFASSEEEIEEWTQEQTCHKNRLTVRDTLTIENGLRRLGEEVEEEALEDEEIDVEDDDEDLDDDDDDDDDVLEDELDRDEDDEDEEENEDKNDDVVSIASYKTVSTAGFQTDDEGGFAVSDDESDAGSDDPWWAPGRSSAVAFGDQPEHIRPSAGHRSLSDSSTESLTSATGSARMFHKAKKPPKHRNPVAIRPRSPELPDSTDFVCGTLDEDRPLEAAYYSALEQRRAAKHKAVPQDIDPTFPTSDPEMEDDEDDDEVQAKEDESDQHMLMHGQLDQIHEVGGRGRSRAGSKRSPKPSPKRLRSPPPRRAACISPKRPRSPAPVLRLRSPAPSRRPCLDATSKAHQAKFHCAKIGNGPVPTFAASLPRPCTVFNDAHDDDEESESHTDTFKRGPMDIKAGTALKRQRRKEKLYMKHCRKQCKEKERRPAPGRGVERMKEMGLGLAAYKGKKAEPVHVLSY